MALKAGSNRVSSAAGPRERPPEVARSGRMDAFLGPGPGEQMQVGAVSGRLERAERAWGAFVGRL
jgi:hypothetical protein